MARHQRVLGDQRERMPRLSQHLDQLPRQRVFALDWLIRISIDAQRNRAGHIPRPRQLPPQQFRRICFGEQPGFEIQARRQIEIRVRGPCKTVATAMLAAAIRIDRLREPDVRRLIAADNAARGFLGDLGAQCGRGERLAVVGILAIVHRLLGGDLEPSGQMAGRTTALDRICHLVIVRLAGLMRRDCTFNTMKLSDRCGAAALATQSS